MNDNGVHEFVLHDSRGNPHAYMLVEHPAGEGWEVMCLLMSMGIPSVLQLAGAALKAEKMIAMVMDAFTGNTDDETTKGDWSDLAGVAVELDLPAVGRELGAALAKNQIPGLTRRLLAHVTRDSQPVAQDVHFDMAFRANYVELMKLILKVCQTHRFFPELPTLPTPNGGTGTTAGEAARIEPQTPI